MAKSPCKMHTFLQSLILVKLSHEYAVSKFATLPSVEKKLRKDLFNMKSAIASVLISIVIVKIFNHINLSNQVRKLHFENVSQNQLDLLRHNSSNVNMKQYSIIDKKVEILHKPNFNCPHNIVVIVLSAPGNFKNRQLTRNQLKSSVNYGCWMFILALQCC